MSASRRGPLSIELWNATEFYTWAGLHLIEASGGRSRLTLDVAPHHRGGAGGPAVNGGIIGYLFDAVCAAAVASTWDEGVTSQATVHLDISFLRLLHVERRVAAEAEVAQRGNRTVFVDARALDEAGNVCAVAHGVYHLFRSPGGPPAGGPWAEWPAHRAAADRNTTERGGGHEAAGGAEPEPGAKARSRPARSRSARGPRKSKP